MKDKISLPLSFLISTEVAENELLKRNQLQRLLVIGKSDNARGSPYGIYRTIGEVKAHYGVEASEYRIASHYFNQVENGELVIASADYESIDRIIEIEPPLVVEPEPEDDTDFKREYMSVGYEPIDVEIEPEPEPEPEPEVEPEPEPISCISTKIEFDNVDLAKIDGFINICCAIEVRGVEYKVSTGEMYSLTLLNSIENKGVGYVSNYIVAMLISDLVKSYPANRGFIYEHTNFAISSFDFGKELGGIDTFNKDSFAEQVEYTGGEAYGFIKDPAEIKFKNLTDSELNKRGSYIKSVNLLDLFKKGRELILSSCLSFKYMPPEPQISTTCQASEAEFVSFDDYYIADGGKIKVVAVVEADGVSEVVTLTPFDASLIANLVKKNGASYNANQMISAIVGLGIAKNDKLGKAFYEGTNYTISKFDYSVELSGLDSNNKDRFKKLVEANGGRAEGFRNNRRSIKISAIRGYDLYNLNSDDATATNFVDLFNDGDNIVINSCLSYDYEPIKHDVVIVPEEPEPEPEDSDTALIINLTPEELGVYEGNNKGVITVQLNNQEADTDYTGYFSLKINGVLIADNNGIYDEKVREDEEEAIVEMHSYRGLAFFLSTSTIYDSSDELYKTGNTRIEIDSDAYSVMIAVDLMGDKVEIVQLPKRSANKHIRFSIPSGFNGFVLPKELPKNITDLSYAFSDYDGNIDIDWDVSHVESFESAFSTGNYNGKLFNGSSFESAKNVSGMFANNKTFNQPLNWIDFDSNSIDYTDIFDGTASFNQNIDIFDSSTWTLDDFNEFFGQNMPSFNQDLSHWSTANTPESYLYNSDEYEAVLRIKSRNPNWTAPKPIFGSLYERYYDAELEQVVDKLLTDRFTPDFVYQGR